MSHPERRTDRTFRRWPAVASATLGLFLLACAAPRAAAQRPATRDSLRADSLARDSLAARLARAEAAIELLRRQLAVEASSVVRTRSRIQIELSARIMTNLFVTDGRVNNVDVPQFALPDPAVPPTLPGAPPPASPPGSRATGLTLRQSRVGAALSVDSVLGGTFEGDVELDFFGGVSTSPGERRLYPEPRLRTARARLLWDRTAIFIGSDTPLISDLSPISVAAVGLPGFVTAGNLWNWLPQVRLSRDVLVSASGIRIGAQVALLTPFSGVQHPGETDGVDAGERSGRPYVEGRLHVRWGAGAAGAGAPSDVMLGDAGGELGVGVHRGWLRSSGDSLTTSEALSLDARVMITPQLEVRGEAYRGQLLRGLGGGAIGQNFGRAQPGEAVGAPIRTTAGWFQANLQAHPTFITGAGCGREVVNTDDLPLRESNLACAAHLLWRPAQPILIGLEFRRIATRYSSVTNHANHLNLAFGFEL